MSFNKSRINKLNEKIKSLNIELNKYQTLATIYSAVDYQVLNEYDKKINKLNNTLLDLYTTLQELESA